ncbi:MAG: enoyl-CoA hydratase/isomerase family protein [Planctomycetes bacterium]|nr:enoyl-CoA hydratase/isomerase family protein [Planctomycetota bacterium]
MSAIQLTVRPDSVAVLTFDQPGSKANVLTSELWTELDAVLDSVASRSDVKGLVLASAKPGIFIAGADLNLLANAAGPNDPAVRGFIEQGLRVLEKLEALPFPTCAAIDGAALGGGLEVALACDIRIVGTNPKVRLGLPEVTLGIIPGWGGTQRLPRVLDMNHWHIAARMLTSGQSVTFQEAKAEALVSEVVESATLTDQTAYYTLRLDFNQSRESKFEPSPMDDRPTIKPWENLTGAAAEAVRVMVEGAALPLKQAIAIETEAFMRLAGSDESKRLIGEFFASRKK